ncbi:MAG: hypothetical protein LBT54_05450, partial [Bifidobacteriaceae bacterium]|nr:hypothetical protein [Bifidobacteriaceae bacterium]
MTRAPAADQQRLLGVQDLDTKIQQAGHRKSHLEAAQRLTEVRARLEEAELASATAHAELGDVQRELTRAEDVVEKVRARQD